MKILFLVPYPSEGASNRFRIEQYLPLLRQNGISYTVRPFISPGFYRILYHRAYFARKICFFIWCSLARCADVIRALRYDLVFIHRESYPLGPPFIERFLRFFKKRIIFDFDDAIFLPATSGSNIFMDRFKRYGKVPEVIALSDHIIAGNRYLAEFALKYNENVTIIPTPVDTDTYVPKTAPHEDSPGEVLRGPAGGGKDRRLKTEHRTPNTENRVIIGWIGSKTTSLFLEPMREVFKALTEKYPNVRIHVVGGEFDAQGIKRILNLPWSLDNEPAVLQGFDIGIMPMPDTKWTRGKCAFKAILYMSVGIPCVSSPVGMNREVITDGVNGFLASSPGEWIEKLSTLIESRALRKTMGERGREMAVEKYSVKAHAPGMMNIVNKVPGKAKE
jgi:glycosyltransferase involved in cell wall biosynthesis